MDYLKDYTSTSKAEVGKTLISNEEYLKCEILNAILNKLRDLEISLDNLGRKNVF